MVDCLYEEIKKKIDSLFNETKLLMKEKDSKATNGESKQRKEKMIERKLYEIETLITDMEKESFQASAYKYPSMKREIKRLKMEHEALERAVLQRQQLYIRKTSYGGCNSPSTLPPVKLKEEKTPLLQDQHHDNRSSNILARSNKVAFESEEIGHQLLSEMDEQRNQLLHARTTVSFSIRG